ncbi:uncharacterized protein LOC120177849 [Hibiscus syriacus]|uniref:uncharacterized protein LOC120177849 n=1 Tax=Hibiscus syriacus TaxID=106335 RepID=UPI001923B21A|nr:uncharacterized protein LOC120177849 [Hibiscus syriacus]
MANFWCRKLILPKEIIRTIEQLCSRFFWKGSNLPAKGARVSWWKICLLRSEGGLGVQDIGGWNKAYIVQLIRKLLANEGSLWVAWLRAYVIRNGNFWQMNIPKNVSWNFECLLKAKPSAFHLLVDPANLNARRIWENMCVKEPKVPWQRLVWFPGRIPKHSIIVWMAILNRLPTRVRLQKMGLNIDDVNCLLCGLEAETRDHLFFNCSFAKNLWGSILALCGISHAVSSWDDVLAWAIHCLKGNSFIVKIFKLAWAGHVYCIWRERNGRLFGNTARSMDVVLKDIKEVIRIRLAVFVP